MFIQEKKTGDYDKVQFKAKKITTDTKGNNIIMKRLSKQKYTILDVYSPNNKASIT